MLKKILSVLMVMAMLGLAGATVGCEKDEVKIHSQSEKTIVTQKPVVVP